MTYPTTIDSFTTKLTGDTVQASHVNDLQTATVALETKVGITGSAVSSTLDYKVTNAASVSPGHKHVVADITDAGSFIVTGMILPYAGTSSPTGFLQCDGSAVSRTTYASLFSLFSTTFGIGDGSTTFNVPDLRSRTIMGVGTGTKVLTFASRATNTITVTGSANSTTNEVQTGQAILYHSTGSTMTGLTDATTYYIIRVAYNQFTLASSLTNALAGTAIALSSDGSGVQTFTYTLSARTRGDTGGEETHAVATAELPAHAHNLRYGSAGGGSNLRLNSTSSFSSDLQNNLLGSADLISSVGSGNAHNNISPFLALNYIIKT